MINTLLEHIPIKMEKENVDDDGGVDVDGSDNEEDEEDTDLSVTDEDEASLMISSEEEAELEAQRINFHEFIGKSLLQSRHRVRGRSASSNCSSIKSTTTTSSSVVVVAAAAAAAVEQQKQTTRRTKIRTYSSCSVASSLITPSSETESCGNIYVYQELQKLIFNCSFCDLRYSNMAIFSKHLHDAHKIFQDESDGGAEETKKPMAAILVVEPQRKSARNAARRSVFEIKVKQERPAPEDELEPLFTLPPASVFMESCGNIFVINNKKLFLICGFCERKYANLELFHKHLRQQHQLFSGPTTDIDVLPKTEVKTETTIVKKLHAPRTTNVSAVEDLSRTKSLSSSPITIQPMVAIPDGFNLSKHCLMAAVLAQTPETPPPEESIEKEMEGKEPNKKQGSFITKVSKSKDIENNFNPEEKIMSQKSKELEILVPQERVSVVGTREKESEQRIANKVNTNKVESHELMNVEEVAPQKLEEKVDAKEMEPNEELENKVNTEKVMSQDRMDTNEVTPTEKKNANTHDKFENKVNTKDVASQVHPEVENLLTHVVENEVEKDEEKMEVPEEKEEEKVKPTRKRKRKSTYIRRRSPSKRTVVTTKAAKATPEPTAATTRLRRTSSTQKSYKDFFIEQHPPSSPESATSSKSILQHLLRLPESALISSAATVNIKESSDSNSVKDFPLDEPATSLSTVKFALPFSVAKELRFACDQCPKAFKKSSRLTEHKRLHTGEKPFSCDECGKQFRIKMRLTEHKMRHRKEKAFKCETCSLRLATKQDLTQHQRHHNDDRRYRCPECPKAFVRSSDLKIHVRVHTGEKPYECEICQRSFRANQNLIVHRRSHLGEKKYKCDYCEKSFMRNIDRKVHMRSHTGEKPFKCEICQRGYSSRVHVRAHIEREHVQTANGTRPERKKPGPRPKQIKEELAKQKKLIEELQQKFLDQIKTDENILPHEHVTAQQQLQQPQTQRQQPSSPIIRKQQRRQSQQSPSARLLQKIEQHSPPLRAQGDGSGVQQVSVTVSMQVENVAAVAEKENESSMLTRSHSPLKENATTLTTAKVKKERKITSFFTVVGQKTEI